MSVDLSVDTDQLHAGYLIVSEEVGNFSAQCEKLLQQTENLQASSWKGDDCDAFINYVYTFKSARDEMKEILNGLADDVYKMKVDYEDKYNEIAHKLSCFSV